MPALNPYVYQAITIKAGLRLYMKTGMKPNRMWTPSAMMRTASNITGKKFKARDYQGAIDALEALLQEAEAEAAE